MLENEKILCITMSDWDDHKGCRHHIMNLLADRNEVVWVEKVVHLDELAAKGIARFFKWLKPVKTIKQNLCAITPPPAIPLIDKIPVVNRLNDWIFFCFLKMKLKKLNFNPNILWLFSYYAYFTVGKFNEEISIYYCNDQFSLWELKHNIKKEELLSKKADLIFTPNYKITEDKKRFNHNSFSISHGVDTTIFKKDSIYIPDELKTIKHPIIGYVGNIRHVLDIDLIKHIAQKHPDWSILLVGPLVYMSASEKNKWHELASYANVNLLGGKDVSSLPAYINSLDVALLPYHVTDENKWITIPLKFFEYLSLGKPVVSTNFTTFEEIPECYYSIACNYDDFVHKIEENLKTDSSNKEKQRIEFAQKNSWQNRLEEISNHITATRKQKKLSF